jgi:hypothetical protein
LAVSIWHTMMSRLFELHAHSIIREVYYENPFSPAF